MAQKLVEVVSVTELEEGIADNLEQQGFTVTRAARIPGKSGIEQVFNMVGKLDDSFADCTLAINVSAAREREDQLQAVFGFANAAYDANLQQRTLVTVFPFDNQAKNFGQMQNIRIIDAQQVKEALAIKPKRVVAETTPFVFESKEQLLQALTNRGYRFEEEAHVRGRSGTEYIFNILAYGVYGLATHSVAIDIFEEDVSLAQVSLFDSKSFDSGINHKVIAIKGKITPEARQFAEHQQIKVIAPAQSLIVEPETAEDTIGLDEKKVIAEAPDSASKTETRAIKQTIQPDAVQLIPEVMARRYNAIPLAIAGDVLQVAMADPNDVFALEAFAVQSRKHIKPVIATSEEIRQAIDFNYKAYNEIEEQVSRITFSNETGNEKLITRADAPLSQALDLIIAEAAKARASDIHIEPEESRLRVRYRIDGVLHDTLSLPLNTHRALVSRIKILGEMNIADQHRPQDGQFTSVVKDRQLDIRVATAPTVHGEMVVMRLLDKSVPSRGLSELGMSPGSLKKYERILHSPYGMILVSGPTGSGKTTTLYASISTLDKVGRNIITIEDPAEYRIRDINQIQVNTQAGITFASGLRSILRLDPDVVLVGEVRDRETASIAIQAALTGHLVLSSIHANDSVGTLSRLLDLDVESFLIASSVIGVVAQRMVRRICPDCSHVIEAPVIEQIAYEKIMNEKLKQFHYGTGCPTCSYTGYLRRVGVFEILPVTDNIRKMLSERASKNDIYEQAYKDGMVSMIKDGMLKVKVGITTPSEVLRVTYTQE